MVEHHIHKHAGAILDGINISADTQTLILGVRYVGDDVIFAGFESCNAGGRLGDDPEDYLIKVRDLFARLVVRRVVARDIFGELGKFDVLVCRVLDKLVRSSADHFCKLAGRRRRLGNFLWHDDELVLVRAQHKQQETAHRFAEVEDHGRGIGGLD